MVPLKCLLTVDLTSQKGQNKTTADGQHHYKFQKRFYVSKNGITVHEMDLIHIGLIIYKNECIYSNNIIVEHSTFPVKPILTFVLKLAFFYFTNLRLYIILLWRYRGNARRRAFQPYRYNSIQIHSSRFLRRIHVRMDHST